MENAPGSTDENDSYRCRVDWNLYKYEKLLDKFNKHYDAIKKIARMQLQADSEDKPFEPEGELYDFWNTYLRPFDIGDIDHNKIRDIDDRLDTIEWVKTIAANVAKGNSIGNFEKEALAEYIDIKVSDEERRYRAKYSDNVTKEWILSILPWCFQM